MGLLGVVLIAAMYLISSAILMTRFAELENNSVKKNVDRIRLAISESLLALDGTACDYAFWDETYEFMKNRNPKYLKENIVNSTFTNLRFNLMFFVEPSGKIIFQKAVDWRKGQDISISTGIQKHLVPGGPFFQLSDISKNIQGILMLPDGPILLVARPILTSDEKGPARGILIIGRYFDAAEIDRLGKITHLSFTVNSYDDLRLPEDFRLAKINLTDNDIFVRPLDQKTIGGYCALKDIYDQNALLMKVKFTRNVYLQAIAGRKDLFLAILIVGLCFGCATLILMEKCVLLRLDRLGMDIDRIRTSKDISRRVAITGNDELAKLANTINDTFETLEQTQADLRESESRYHAVVEQVEEAIVLIDLEFNCIIGANPAFRKMFGYSLEEIRNLTSSDFAAHHDPTDKIWREIIKARRFESTECKMYRKNGSIFDAELTVNFIHYGGRQVLCAILRDITERKQTQENLRRAKDELERRVQERTLELVDTNKSLHAEIQQHKQTEKELRKARDAAEAAIKTKSEFLSNITHELRTPMNGIIGMTDLVLDTELSSTQREYLELAKKSADHLMKLIDQILDFSRMETGKFEIRNVDFSLYQCIDDLLASWMPTAEEKGISLSCCFAPDVPDLLVGDADRLRKLTENLIDNAFKFTESGSVTLCVDSRKNTPEAVTLHFAVSDTGIGIEPDKQQAIFEAFAQADGTSTRQYGGLGLGLTVSANLIAAMGGKIWVESPATCGVPKIGGPGSIFHFTLPFKKQIDGLSGEETYCEQLSADLTC